MYALRCIFCPNRFLLLFWEGHSACENCATCLQKFSSGRSQRENQLIRFTRKTALKTGGFHFVGFHVAFPVPLFGMDLQIVYLSVSVVQRTAFEQLVLLLCPRERLLSIVMSMSVCLSACPRGYLWNRTRDLYQIFCACCLCPWLGPPLSC